MRAEKQVVRDFYDNCGWERVDGAYRDTVIFDDLRTVLAEYRRATHARVSRFLAASGEGFLDAGSGPIPHAEYVAYSIGFVRRVCIDLSRRALTEARTRLGDHGVYVVADVTRLPFADGTFDASVSAHVLYHVPFDEQAMAAREIWRTLAPGRTAVIIYQWPEYWYSRLRSTYRAFLRELAALPGLRRAWRAIRGIRPDVANKRGDTLPVSHSMAEKRPPLYCQPHDYRWFRETFAGELRLDILAWRSVDPLFTRTWVPDGRAGKAMMRLILWAEDNAPRLMGRVGRYPLIVLRKPP